MNAAAMLMQMSATLKTGKLGKRRKSTTCPRSGLGSRNTRSVRLPRMPASRNPSPMAQPVLRSRRTLHSVTPAATIAMHESTRV